LTGSRSHASTVPCLSPQRLSSEDCPAVLRCSSFFDQRAANHHPLNLICAFVDLRDLGIAHVLFNRIIPAVTVTTKQLNRIRSYFHRGVGGENLGHCRYLRNVLHSGVHRSSCRVNQMPRRFDLRSHVGEHKLNALKRRDRLPELLSLLCVFEREIERALRDAQTLSSDEWARYVERHHRVLEAATFGAS